MNLKSLILIFSSFLLLTFYSCQDELELDPEESISIYSPISSKRICLTEAHMQSLMQDDTYRQQREKRLQSFKKFSTNNTYKANCSTPTIVPVAIHFQGISSPNENCLRSLSIDQINRLNADYQGENSDISSWTNQASNQFPGISNGEMCVQFVIADQNHPSGYGLNNGDLAITYNRTQGDQENNWAGYVNIFIQPNTGYLGYAPLGGAGNGDGVVIDASAFGAGQGCGDVAPQSPYNLGRTLTHEMGHYLLLDHIWGNGCVTDDEVGDTPDQASDYSGCPSLGASSCGSADMHMNYMDYTDDACMYMFSQGQESRMTNYMLANLTNVTGNASNVYSGGGGGTGDECLVPTGITISNISNQSSLVSWTGRSNATSYDLQWRISGHTGFQGVSVSGTSRSLNGLQENTVYEVRVRTNCGSDNSSFSGLTTFTTNGNKGGGDECLAPTGVVISNITEQSSLVSWSGQTNATSYDLQWRISGHTGFQSVSVNGTSRGLNGLQENTVYEVRVRTNCGSDNSPFSTVTSFSTTGNSGGGNECIAPTSADVQIRNASSVRVDWADIPDAIKYQVRYRVAGTSSWTKKGAANSHKILNNLLPELYEYQLRTKCPSGWTSWSAKWTFDLGTGGGSGSYSIMIKVTLDDYGSETSWELYNASNALISNGGPYQDGQNGTVKTKEVTLSDGCYEIDLYDAFGDGICCDYGNGSFEVVDSNNQRLAYSDGNFGTYELIAFCVSNGQARITKRERDAKKLNRGTKSKAK